MTPRERKYHLLKRFNKFARRLHFAAGLPFDRINPISQDFYKFWCPQNGGIYESASPSEPVTITITKYNLPNNSSLQKGQLN